MRGAIIGDIVGSVFKDTPQQNTDFQLLKPFSAYTDDTILTIATADAILNEYSYVDAIRSWARKYPKAGYQEGFLNWVMIDNNTGNYSSNGDGAARRISPIGFAAKNLSTAVEEAGIATTVTHPSAEKVKASQALSGAIYLANTGCSKQNIRDFLRLEFQYEIPEKLEKKSGVELSADYNSPAPGAILAFLNSETYEDAIRKAIWMDGPRNTNAAIAGGLAQAYYKHIPKSIYRKALQRIDNDIELVLSDFEERYCPAVKEGLKKQIQVHFH